MGCGASSSNQAVAPPDALSPPEQMEAHALPGHKSTATVFANVRPHLSVMCRDQFNSKYTNELMYRWRPAEIVQVEGEGNDRILVHYTGWADTFDHWVDLKTELAKIAPSGLLSPEHCKKGQPLTDEQYRLTLDYFRSGKEVEPLPVAKEPQVENATNTSNAVTMESNTETPSTKPATSPDPDAEFVIPTKKLPDPPKIPTAPTPVKGTRRTPSSAAVDGIAGNGMSPPRLQPPPLPQLSPPTGPPSAGLPQPPSTAPRRRSGPPVAPQPPQAAAAEEPEKARGSENPYAVSDMLDVLDIFYKKGATQPSQKWRPAEIVAIDGDFITIHYLNWDAKYDERLHHLNDNHRLSSFGSKTTRHSMSSSVSSGGHSIGGGDRTSGHSRSASMDGTQPPPSSAVAALNGASEGTELDKGAQRRLSLKSPTNAAGSGTGTSDKQSADGATPSTARAVDPQTGLTAEQSRFTRNFLNYRKKKQAEKDKETASPPSDSVVTAAETPRASEGGSGGFLKQFTNLFGARDAGAVVSTATETAAISATAAPGGNHGAGGANGVANGAEAAGAQPGADESEERDEEEIARREQEFLEKLEAKGLHVFAIEGDGNCLFRAVSHQLYLHQDMHEELRACCVEHLTRHRKRFEVFCEGDFDEYLKNMSKAGIWGDDLEIRALEEITDRLIVIYSSNAENVLEPINNSFEEKNLLKGVPPLTLSYHGNSHYNSIYDERYPLPLVHRKSRLLLRSRMALNKQDVVGAGHAGSGGSHNGDSSQSSVYSEHSAANGTRTSDWRKSSHHQQQQQQYQTGGYGGRGDYNHRNSASGAYANSTAQQNSTIDDAQQYQVAGYHYPSAYGSYGSESNAGVHYAVAQQQKQLAAYGDYGPAHSGYDYAAQQQQQQQQLAIASSYGGSTHGAYSIGSSSGEHDSDLSGNGGNNNAVYDPYAVQHRQPYAYGDGYHHQPSHQQAGTVDYTRRGY